MRILIHGLQNSGATLFAFFVGQNAGSLVLPDVWSMYCAPRWDTSTDLCVKTTLTTSFSIDDHKNNFCPDINILVLRCPKDNYLSLISKDFRNDDGLMEEKFLLLDSIYKDYKKFDCIVRFEDFILNPEAIRFDLCERGWDMPTDAQRLTRTPHDMEMAVWRSSPELYDIIKWGTGNSRVMPIKDIQLFSSNDQAAYEFAWRYAPRLSKNYEDNPPRNTFTSRISNVKCNLLNQYNNFAKEYSLPNGLPFNIDALQKQIIPNKMIKDDIANCMLSAYWHSRLTSTNSDTDIKQAVEKILEFIKVDDNHDLIMMLARYFFDVSKFEIAEYLARNILAKKSYDTKYCFLISEIMIKTGGIVEAEEAMRYQLTSEPRSAFNNYRLAELLWHHGRKEEASEILRFCIKLERDFAPAREMLERGIS